MHNSVNAKELLPAKGISRSCRLMRAWTGGPGLKPAQTSNVLIISYSFIVELYL